MIGHYYLLVTMLVVSVTAFSPSSSSTTTTPSKSFNKFTFQQSRIVPSTRLSKPIRTLSSSNEPESETTTSTTATEGEKKVISQDGTFYDDEVDPIPVTKVGISETMKERLIREASTGLDADKPQNNVILYIIGIVSLLVILGGKDIFY